MEKLTIYYCKSCDKTYDNVYKGNSKNAEFAHGYIGGWGHGLTKCPYCQSELIDTNLPDNDFNIIRDVSNYNREVLDAMIKLKNQDIIEYELKMSQFRTQYEQQQSLKQSQVQQTGRSDNRPKCPTCGSTNIEKISVGKKLGGGFLFGIFSSDVRNTMHCKDCGAKW